MDGSPQRWTHSPMGMTERAEKPWPNPWLRPACSLMSDWSAPSARCKTDGDDADYVPPDPTGVHPGRHDDARGRRHRHALIHGRPYTDGSCWSDHLRSAATHHGVDRENSAVASVTSSKGHRPDRPDNTERAWR